MAAGGLVIYQKPPGLNEAAGLIGQVTNVYTRRDWRNRGIATELMKRLVSHARTLGVERLHLSATEAGKAVYERVGFQTPKFAQLELKL